MKFFTLVVAALITACSGVRMEQQSLRVAFKRGAAVQGVGLACEKRTNSKTKCGDTDGNKKCESSCCCRGAASVCGSPCGVTEDPNKIETAACASSGWSVGQEKEASTKPPSCKVTNKRKFPTDTRDSGELQEASTKEIINVVNHGAAIKSPDPSGYGKQVKTIDTHGLNVLRLFTKKPGTPVMCNVKLGTSVSSQAFVMCKPSPTDKEKTCTGTKTTIPESGFKITYTVKLVVEGTAHAQKADLGFGEWKDGLGPSLHSFKWECANPVLDPKNVHLHITIRKEGAHVSVEDKDDGNTVIDVGAGTGSYSTAFEMRYYRAEDKIKVKCTAEGP